MNVASFKKQLEEIGDNEFNTILVHPEVFMRLEEPTKWEEFLDGFRNVLYILDCYDDGDEWGYGEFWESLSIGWYREYIFPYDDPYNLTISPERRLRLSQEPEKIILSAEDFDALVDRLNEPPQYNENLAKLFQRKAPWDEEL